MKYFWAVVQVNAVFLMLVNTYVLITPIIDERGFWWTATLVILSSVAWGLFLHARDEYAKARNVDATNA